MKAFPSLDLSLKESNNSESFSKLTQFALPEMCSATLLVFLPIIVDFYFILNLKNSSTYAIFSVSTTLTYLFFKIADAIGIATSTFVGINNGKSCFNQAGKSLQSSLITSSFLGLLLWISFKLFAQYFFFNWMKFPLKEVEQCIAFLKMQIISTICSFFFMSFAGFFRGTKNSVIPMLGQVLSIMFFLFFDYALILGKFGFCSHGLYGSAYASIIRYLSGTAFFILCSFKYKDQKYFVSFLETPNWLEVYNLINFSIPIILDKSIIAIAYIWLYKIAKPIHPKALLIIEIVKNVERLAFIPAIGFAQVTNFLISNNLGEKKINLMLSHLKKLIILTISFLSILMMCLAYSSTNLFSLLLNKDIQTEEITVMLKIVSFLVLIDGFQTILASFLRTTGNSFIIIKTRFLSFLLFYGPTSYFITQTYLLNPQQKLIFVYIFFYVTLALIGIIFGWQTKVFFSNAQENILSQESQLDSALQVASCATNSATSKYFCTTESISFEDKFL